LASRSSPQPASRAASRPDLSVVGKETTRRKPWLCTGRFHRRAPRRHARKIAQSSGGTLFLDEIGDMPLVLQTRLLRALEEQEVTPLGGDAALKVDLRVICASHRDLRALVESGGKN
jgi:transcriptional regulator of acetoin/glycerol metabolism